MKPRPIENVLKEQAPALMALPGVTGIAQGSCGGAPCIKVLVTSKHPELRERIPARIESYAVEIIETGELFSLDEE